jgi:hypothetical protein
MRLRPPFLAVSSSLITRRAAANIASSHYGEQRIDLPLTSVIYHGIAAGLSAIGRSGRAGAPQPARRQRTNLLRHFYGYWPIRLCATIGANASQTAALFSWDRHAEIHRLLRDSVGRP